MSTLAAFLKTPAGGATISAGASLLSGFFGSRRRKREQRAAKARYEEMKAAYEGLDTSNIYADVTNPYLGMENTMEDLTVNTQQAEFQARQGAQARADILGRFRETAGGSGIAALAQSLANQQTQQTAQISASIGAQEAANQRAAAMQAGRIQQLERAGELQAQQIRMGGEAQSRALEYQKTSTMFGMGQQRLAVANQALAQSQAQLASGIGGLAAAYATGQFGNQSGGDPTPGSFEQTVSTSGDYNNNGIMDIYEQGSPNYNATLGTGSILLRS